jgi:hypothetical protein
MYIELRSSGFRDTEFRSFHERIVEALRRRDSEAVRQAIWDDITEGQGATVSFGKMPSPATLLGARYAANRPPSHAKQVTSLSKTGDKS